jgi:hypothetical protein
MLSKKIAHRVFFFQNITQTSTVNSNHEMSAAALLLIFLFKGRDGKSRARKKRGHGLMDKALWNRSTIGSITLGWRYHLLFYHGFIRAWKGRSLHSIRKFPLGCGTVFPSWTLSHPPTFELIRRLCCHLATVTRKSGQFISSCNFYIAIFRRHLVTQHDWSFCLNRS